MENFVVEFDASNPPSDGANVGGFRYLKRTKDDEDFLIRVSDRSTLTEEGLNLWRIPKVLPEPVAEY
jgi:hypothetical protein